MNNGIYGILPGSHSNSLSALPIFQSIKDLMQNSQNNERKNSLTHMFQLQNNKVETGLNSVHNDLNGRFNIRRGFDEFTSYHMNSLFSYSATRSEPHHFSNTAKGRVDHLRIELENENIRREKLHSLGNSYFKPIGSEDKSRRVEPAEEKQNITVNSIYNSIWSHNRTSNYSNINLSSDISPFIIQDQRYSTNGDISDENQASNLSCNRNIDNFNSENSNGPDFHFHESIHMHENEGFETSEFDNRNILGLSIQQEDEEIQEEENVYYDNNEDEDDVDWDDDAICYDDDDNQYSED